MNYKTSIRLLFEAALLEGERRMQMKRDSDEYPGGPAEKQLYQAKPGQLTPDGKKQLQKASADYVAATKKARAEKKVESIRNNFNNILSEMIKPEGKPKPVNPKKAAMDEKRKKFVPGGGINPKHAPKGGNIKEATYQAGKAKSPDKYGVRRGTAKLSKSSVTGVSSEEAKHASRRNQERDFHLQRDAKFRKQHGSMSAAERRKENQLMNRPMGLRKKDPEDHYPQS